MGGYYDPPYVTKDERQALVTWKDERQLLY